jgi:hypothetical protein
MLGYDGPRGRPDGQVLDHTLKILGLVEVEDTQHAAEDEDTAYD